MKLYAKYLLGIALIGFSIISCDKEEEDQNNTNTDENSQTTFADVSSIFSTNCGGCHNSNLNAGNLLLTNYSEIKEATQEGDVINRINDEANPMPTSGLMSQANRDLIQSWADDGFLEN